MQDQQPHRATNRVKAEEPWRRIGQATEWLLEGMRPREAVMKGCAAWSVKKRMAQVYVAKARGQLLMEALNKCLMLEVHQVQDMRMRAIRSVSAVLNDPMADHAQKRVMVAYLGQMRGMLADYEKSAVREAELLVSNTPPGDALHRLRAAFEEWEHQDADAYDAANAAAESAAPAEHSAANEPGPAPEQPAPAADVAPLAKVPPVETDETAPALSTLGEELAKPVAPSASLSTNGHHAHAGPGAQLSSDLAVAASSCSHSLSDFLTKNALR